MKIYPSKKISTKIVLANLIAIIVFGSFLPRSFVSSQSNPNFTFDIKVDSSVRVGDEVLVPKGAQNLKFVGSVKGVANNACVSYDNPDVFKTYVPTYIVRYSVGNNDYRAQPHPFYIKKDIDNTDFSVSIDRSETFGDSTVLHFEAIAVCIPKFDPVGTYELKTIQNFNKPIRIDVRTSSAVGGKLIDASKVKAEWVHPKTILVGTGSTKVTLKLQKIRILRPDGQPMQKQDILTYSSGEKNRVVDKFGFSVDKAGTDPSSWGCEGYFINDCAFPGNGLLGNGNYKNFDNPFSPPATTTVIEHTVTFSDFSGGDKTRDPSIEANRKTDGFSFGFMIVPLIEVEKPGFLDAFTDPGDIGGVDLPVIDKTKFITIKFTNKLSSNEQEETEELVTGGGIAADQRDSGNSVAGTIADVVAGGTLSLINTMIGTTTAIIRWIIWIITSFIIIPILETTLTMSAGSLANPTIIAGWTFVRDIVNMVFILVLIVIGFGTILKLENYSFKKLLVNLIIMALLVNFSMLIARIILEVADTIQFTFLPAQVTGEGGGAGVTGVKYFFNSLSTAHIGNIIDGLRGFTFDSSKALGVTASLIMQLVLELGVAVTFTVLAAMMMVRTVAIWILLILSPVAYAFFILPQTASLASKWWDAFIRYAFFAPIIAFFMRITLELYRKGLSLVPQTTFSDLADKANVSSANSALAYGGSLVAGTSDVDLITYMNQLAEKSGGVSLEATLDLILIYAMILAFLWAGIIVSRHMSIIGATAVTGAAIGLPIWAAKSAGGLIAEGYSGYLGSKGHDATREAINEGQASKEYEGEKIKVDEEITRRQGLGSSSNLSIKAYNKNNEAIRLKQEAGALKILSKSEYDNKIAEADKLKSERENAFTDKYANETDEVYDQRILDNVTNKEKQEQVLRAEAEQEKANADQEIAKKLENAQEAEEEAKQLDAKRKEVDEIPDLEEESKGLGKEISFRKHKAHTAHKKAFRYGALQFLNPVALATGWHEYREENTRRKMTPAGGQVHDVLNRVLPTQWGLWKGNKDWLGKETEHGYIGRKKVLRDEAKAESGIPLNRDEITYMLDKATKSGNPVDIIGSSLRATENSVDDDMMNIGSKDHIYSPYRYLEHLTGKLDPKTGQRTGGLWSSLSKSEQAATASMMLEQSKKDGKGRNIYWDEITRSMTNDFEHLKRNDGALFKKFKKEVLQRMNESAPEHFKGNGMYKELENIQKMEDVEKSPRLLEAFTGARSAAILQREMSRGDVAKWMKMVEPAALMEQGPSGYSSYTTGGIFNLAVIKAGTEKTSASRLHQSDDRFQQAVGAAKNYVGKYFIPTKKNSPADWERWNHIVTNKPATAAMIYAHIKGGRAQETMEAMIAGKLEFRLKNNNEWILYKKEGEE